MKRQRSNAEKSTTDDAAAIEKSTRKMMRCKVAGADPDHLKDGGGGGGAISSTINAAATATATMGTCAAVATPAVEREYYLCNGGEGGDHLDCYGEMWWSSIWLPSFDVENYVVDDVAPADDACGGGLWDIDDIWNLKSIK